jgi:hypothetical protein
MLEVGKPPGAVEDGYAANFLGLLVGLDGGAEGRLCPVRSPKRRVTVR